MPVEIITNSPSLSRLGTGIPSLDIAVGNPHTTPPEWGMPQRAIVEIAGRQHSGKSTLALGLAARMYKKGKILVADIEAVQDPNYVVNLLEEAGFDGTIEYISVVENKKPRQHAEVLQELGERLSEEDVVAGIFDSVSSYQPIREEAGDIGDANMGRRAQEIGQFTRIAVKNLMNSEEAKNVFVINHTYQVMGQMYRDTAGGDMLKNTSSARIQIKREAQSHVGTYKGRDDFWATGKVVKNRYGGKGRDFSLFFLAGHGVHLGMTAVFECLNQKIATKKHGRVYLDDENYGFISALIEEAENGNEEFFAPFHAALEKELYGEEKD